MCLMHMLTWKQFVCRSLRVVFAPELSVGGLLPKGYEFATHGGLA